MNSSSTKSITQLRRIQFIFLKGGIYLYLLIGSFYLYGTLFNRQWYANMESSLLSALGSIALGAFNVFIWAKIVRVFFGFEQNRDTGLFSKILTVISLIIAKAGLFGYALMAFMTGEKKIVLGFVIGFTAFLFMGILLTACLNKRNDSTN